MQNKRVFNVYIHIPFCKTRCKYCSFVSYCNRGYIDDYFKALEREIKYFYKNESLRTLYIGGGTPSCVSVDKIKNIISLFNYDNNCEITIEVNPCDVFDNYFENLKKTKVNRISLGVQSFNDKILKNIGRNHTKLDAINSIIKANNAGFNNISLDFIYGLPNQTLEDFKDDLHEVVNLDVKHISLYGLKIEKGCYFYKYKPKNIISEDEQAKYYDYAVSFLNKNGFKQYEISNFAKDKYVSKHNLNYWNCGTYYGFGVAACGYINNTRYQNLISLKDYIKNPYKKLSKENLTLKDKLFEAIILGFRKVDGVNIKILNEKFNINFEDKYKNVLEKFKEYLKKDNYGNYFMTKDGFLLSNCILSEFCDD